MKNDLLLLEAKEKGDLLRKAISLIETLSKSEVADNDSDSDTIELNELKDLIVKSRTLVGSRWWDSL